jgi:hypothetical protein
MCFAQSMTRSRYSSLPSASIARELLAALHFADLVAQVSVGAVEKFLECRGINRRGRRLHFPCCGSHATNPMAL